MLTQSTQDFLDALSGKSATPGGGSVAALNGALGAALVTMVCNLTIGKKKYAGVEAEMQTIKAEAERLQADLAALIPADSAAFDQVMAAFGLPRETDAEKQARTQAIQAALKEATRVPLETARACARVLALCKPVAQKGNVNSASDVGAGAQAAAAGLKSAALNVYINLGGLKDADFVARTGAELNDILTAHEHLAEDVYQIVKEKI